MQEITWLCMSASAFCHAQGSKSPPSTYTRQELFSLAGSATALKQAQAWIGFPQLLQTHGV